MKKRILSWVLIFVMCLSILAGKDITFASEYTTMQMPVILNPFYEDAFTDEVNLSEPVEAYADEKLATSSTVYKKFDNAAAYVRKQMVNRNTSISLTVEYDSEKYTPSDVYKTVFSKAIAHFESCTGQEGDALAAGYRLCNGKISSNEKQVQLTYMPTYYSNAEQEAELTIAVNNVLTSLDLNGKSEYQKVRAIYDYICDNVDYDRENLANNPNYLPMRSAYAALCHGKAICQGYAVLFYRMCKDAGLSVRYIVGYGNSGRHAWNIVKIGDRYYNVDSTWDGQDPESYHDYFLKNTVDFGNHVPDESFETADFHTQYPLANDSWEDFSVLSEPLSYSNVASFKYTTLADQTVTNQPSGRAKVLVFGNTGCFNTRGTISSLSKADFSDVDLIYVDTASTAVKSSKDAVISFRNTYGSTTDDITYTYNTNGSNMWSYINLLGTKSTFPLIVYIDSNNIIKGYQSAGVKSAESVRDNVDFFFGNVKLMDLSKSSTTIKVNEKQKLDAYVRGTVCNGQFFTWTSSNPDVASVDVNGNLLGKSEGTTTITCKANNTIYKTCNVTVSGVKDLTYTIKFDGNGSSSGSMKSLLAVVGKEMSLTFNVFTRKGYTFQGWNTKANGSGTAYKDGASVKDLTKTDGATVTLYAQWKMIPYTITYECNGGTNHADNLTSYTKISETVTLKNPSRTGYTFKGWYKDAAFSETSKVTELKAGITGNIKLYAKWSVNKYHIAFKGNGSTSGSTKTLSNLTYNKTYTLTANGYKKTGYTFTGWNTKADGTGKAYADKDVVSKLISSNGKTVTLYAQWSRNSYSIKYVLNNGKNSSSNPTKYHVETATIKLKNPTRTGYTFKGWYTDSKFSSSKKVTEITKGSAGNKTLYAKWAVNKYNIKFSGNGSTSGSTKTLSNLTYNKSYTLTSNVFKRTGYSFAGWNTKADGTGKAYANNAKVSKLTSSNNKTVTLYAQWTRNSYSIKYELNSGKNSSSNPTKYHVETATIKLKNPTRTGYVFKGWYTDSKFSSNKKVTEIKKGSTGNIKLYAKWESYKYNVVFNGNGSSSGKMDPMKNCSYNSTYKLSANKFKKSGYTFAGWNTKPDGSGKSYTNEQKVNKLTSTNKGTVTLYAQWKPTEYKITYKDGYTHSNPKKYTVKSGTIKLKNATREGYKFGGWYTNKNLKSEYRIKQISASSKKNYTLYAKWTKINTTSK